jgi:hypothetical protein
MCLQELGLEPHEGEITAVRPDPKIEHDPGHDSGAGGSTSEAASESFDSNEANDSLAGRSGHGEDVEMHDKEPPCPLLWKQQFGHALLFRMKGLMRRTAVMVKLKLFMHAASMLFTQRQSLTGTASGSHGLSQKIRKLEIVQWGKVIFVLLILAAMLERVKVSGVDSRQHVHSIYAVLALFAEKLYLCAAPRVDALERMRVF